MKKLNVALVGCWHPHVPRYYPILQKREDSGTVLMTPAIFRSFPIAESTGFRDSASEPHMKICGT